MLELLSTIDTRLFLFFNLTLANPVTDFVMPIITSDWLLRVLYALAVLLLFIRGNARLRWLVLFSILALVLTDQVSAGLLKPMIGRLRPCQVLDNINLLVGCGGGKSMPSSHAANAFGQALFFGLLYSRVRWPLVVLAALIALSRVMVGVHYPFDILAGAIVGTLVGWSVAVAARRFVIRYAKTA